MLRCGHFEASPREPVSEYRRVRLLLDKVLLHRFMVGQFLRGDSLPGSGLLCRAGNADAAT
jgi:hypothetical protein